MTKNDDYLWDGSGTPDPDVERLEQMLGRLRTTPAVPRLPESRTRTLHWRTVRFLAPMLAAAAAVVVMVGLTWRATRATGSWEVSSLSGAPRIGSTTLAGTGRLGVGQTLVTDASSRARLDVATIGQVTVDTDTRVRLVATRDAHHQLALDRGTLHAFITAPPGQFVVDTPSATATDLGCVYDLFVDADGSGLLSVVAGWVAFEDNGRESFVPAGASARTHRSIGPGTPRYDDATQAFRDAVDRVDTTVDEVQRNAALELVLRQARERDAMTLWHLIARVGPADRGAVIDALAARVPMPPAVTRDAAMRLAKPALDQWWDALGLMDATWWRMWKGPLPDIRK